MPNARRLLHQHLELQTKAADERETGSASVGRDMLSVPHFHRLKQSTQGSSMPRCWEGHGTSIAHPSRTCLLDGQPFIYRAPEADDTSVLCLAQKAGSSTWKLALLKALGADGFLSRQRRPLRDHPTWLGAAV